MQQQTFTDRLLNVPEMATNDDQLPASDDRKASIYRQAIEKPIASVKVGGG